MKEILVITAPIVAAILGYLFREWQSKVTPFVETLSIEGSMNRAADEVLIKEDEILEIGENSPYISSLKKETTVGNINKIRRECLYYKSLKKYFKDEFSEFIKEKDNVKLQSSLSYFFNDNHFNKLLIQVIAGDRIERYIPDKEYQDEILNVYFDENEDKGTYWVPFKNHTTNVGHQLNREVLNDKFKYFIDTIRYWDIKGIKHYISGLDDIIETHCLDANQLYPVVDNYADINSRWLFKVSIINLNNKPIMIDTLAELSVKSKEFRTIKESCYLLSLDKDENYEDSHSPIIINPGEYKIVGFITNNRQKEMEKGDTLRSLFNKGNATFSMKLNITKSGLIKTQKYSSRNKNFKKKVKD